VIAASPYEGRVMVACSDAYAACGHEHPTFAEARACATALWPHSGTSRARPICHQPTHLSRVVLSAAGRRRALAGAKRYLDRGGSVQ